MCINKSMNMFRAIQEVQQFHIEPILFNITKNDFAANSVLGNSSDKKSQQTSDNTITELIKKYFGNNGQKR